MNDWTPDLSARDKPRYLAIADAIADDIRAGRLAPADRLPPQRKLARRLDVDFTTVARGYVEAQKRGLIESQVGQGTFVRDSARRRHGPMALHPEIVDLSMNLPPEPDDPELIDRMQDGLDAIGHDLVYADALPGVRRRRRPTRRPRRTGSAGRALVPPQDRLFIAPGAHPALLGILGFLAKPGDVMLCEDAHLSRHPLDRGAAWAATGRPADGRRGRRSPMPSRRPASSSSRRPSISIRRCTTRRRIRSREPRRSRSPRSPAASAFRSSKTIPTDFCRSTDRAIRGDRARADLARRRSCQMPRRRTAHRLRRGAGRTRRLAVRGRRFGPRP